MASYFYRRGERVMPNAGSFLALIGGAVCFGTAAYTIAKGDGDPLLIGFCVAVGILGVGVALMSRK